MAFPPLSEVRNNLKPQWYRSKMDPDKFRKFSKKSDFKGFIQAGGHLGLFCITGLSVYLSWLISNWILFSVAIFMHGTVSSFFKGTAVHELGHGTVFETKWLNKFFLYLFSLISWWNPFDYAASHTYHHRYTLHPEGDREVLLPIHPSVGGTFLLQMFTFNLITQPGRTFGKGGLLSAVWLTILAAVGKIGSCEIPANEWLQAIHSDQPEQKSASVRWSQIQLSFHIFILVLAILSGLWVLPFIITIPSYTSNWLSYFLGLTQHCGLRQNTIDFRKNTRSIRLPKFLEYLYWHMNWHTEHHMYAGVPCYNLRHLAKEIEKDMPEPKSLFEAWKEMLYIWQIQKNNPEYAFDTPVPNNPRNSKDMPLGASSIGDLAPKALR
jgi:fatty acid desaturase